jgi:hypothetical protein
LEDLTDLFDRQGRLGHVMQGANHGDCIEKAGHKRQPVSIRSYKNIPRFVSQAFAGLLQLRECIVQQNYTFEAGIPGRVPACARTDFKEQIP